MADNHSSNGTFRKQRRKEEMLKKLLRDEGGQDIIEYGLLACFISIVALVAIRLIGPLIVPLYDAVVAALS